jgi:hypothetical protein
MLLKTHLHQKCFLGGGVGGGGVIQLPYRTNIAVLLNWCYCYIFLREICPQHTVKVQCCMEHINKVDFVLNTL